MLKIKREDEVIVIAGKDKGKRGKVLKVNLGTGRVTVQGVNMVYKHLRKSQKHPQGGRIQLESGLDISNVMLIDPKDGKPTRVRMDVDGNGKKVRVSSRSGEPV